MTARYLVADVFDGLATLEDGSVDVVITSPPFLALRSYLPADDPLKSKEIGSEPTPAAFLDVMLRFTAELRRVLAPHGSICIELGDTYAGSSGGGAEEGFNPGRNNGERYQKDGYATNIPARHRSDGLSTKGSGWPLAKSKTLIPELYRIALAYGINPLTGLESPAGQWRVRNVVTWARPNPPVGALGDKWRPATSDVVVACVSGKRYWDDLATRQAYKPGTLEQYKANPDDPVNDQRLTHSGAPLLDYWEIPLLDGDEPKPYGPKEPPPRPYRTGPETAYKPDEVHSGEDRRTGGQHPAGSPLLDYWVIPPGGYEGSHYAVFPPELVVPLVKAMTPEKVCRECGEPSRRIVETDGARQANPIGPKLKQGVAHRTGGAFGASEFTPNGYETLGWTDCGHNNYRPGLILDCFGGSGTVGLVATGHGHDCILIDLDKRNYELALQRIGPLMLEPPIYVGDQQAAAPQTQADGF